MQWSDAPNAGFCPPGEPWLPLGDVAAINVEAERADPRSMLTLYRRLLALRRGSPALTSGGYRTLVADEATFAYLRDDTLVALNLSERPQAVPLAALAGRVALSSHLDDREDDVAGELRLRPAEAVVVALSAGSG